MTRRTPLSTLLRLRGIRERQAAGGLASARASEAVAHDELETRRRAHDERPGPEAELTASELRILSLQGIRSLELVTQAAVALEEERALVDEARHAWEDATRDLKSTERLDDRRRTEMALEARRASDRALDELVVTRRARRTGR